MGEDMSERCKRKRRYGKNKSKQVSKLWRFIGSARPSQIDYIPYLILKRQLETGSI
jgi:hypothetical protein